MAKAKTPGKALVKWDEEFANLAKESTKGMTLPTAKFLSMRSGKLSYAGADVPDNELRAVIVGWIYENQFYDEDFDPDVPQVPACYGFGTDPDDMQPHEQAPDKQNDACAGCPMNEWGTADRGNGKACKNVVRLALIAESDLEDLATAEVVYMKVPVMSVKNFAMYAKKTVGEALGRPYWAVVTLVSVVPDPKSQFKVQFSVAEKVEDSNLFSPLKDLWQKSMGEIAFPYPKPETVEKPARGKGKGKPSKAAKFARK
jgi:hypothetical protein